jgi:type IV protein arginine methyltransferase
MSSTELDVDASVEALTVLGQQLIDAILARSPLEEIRALIDAGAPLWFQDEDGTSALHAAAYAEDAELIQTLIEEGAVWNAGRAPLDLS